LAPAVAEFDTEPAPAKVNLFLHVTGKRSDGYHLLDSLVVFAGIADRITIARAEDLSLAVTGPFAPSLAADADNLVMRAAHALASAAGVRATGALRLDKQIPVASGVGGGSADAAATLRLLCRAWRLNPDDTVLERIAARLGADVPVCLRNRPMRMRGVGELLTQAPGLPRCGVVLVNPGIPLATASVFRARAVDFTRDAVLPDGWDTVEEMATGLSATANDLQAAAIRLVPQIGDVLHAIADTRGCLLARMSGSGATCFGLFPDVEAATVAAAQLAQPGWWSWSGSFSA
jgi:4-diphosphocytidyl-2-C-methyl-D-erythritol kinase